LLITLILAVADTVTTIIALQKGKVEVNPVVNVFLMLPYGLILWLILKLAVICFLRGNREVLILLLLLFTCSSIVNML